MPAVDWINPEKLGGIVCRPAYPRDTPEVIELTRTIWEGEDYVPVVWQDWLADRQGRLAVAEYEGRVVGLSKLTHLGPGDWWLEGLRVHPSYEGRGIASRLHEYLLAHWLDTGDGTLRLATASFRHAVQHLCDRTGFQKVGEFTHYLAPALSGPVDSFRPLHQDEIQEAVEFALQSDSLSLAYGLMDLSWSWVPPKDVYLEKAANSKNAWWWRGREGLLLISEHKDEQNKALPYIQLLACSKREMVDCLVDYRQMAAGSGSLRAGWNAPLHPGMGPILQAAGFERDWDASIYIYARRHPGVS